MITKPNFLSSNTLEYDEIYGKNGLRILVSIQEERLVSEPVRTQYNVVVEFYGKGQVSPRFILEDNNPSERHEDAHKRFVAQREALSVYKDSKIL